MDSTRKGPRQGDGASSTSVRSRTESSSGYHRGRETVRVFENSYLVNNNRSETNRSENNSNANNSNANNSNTNNSNVNFNNFTNTRRSDHRRVSPMTPSLREVKTRGTRDISNNNRNSRSTSDVRIRPEMGVKKGNIITVVNNSIEFDPDYVDAELDLSRCSINSNEPPSLDNEIPQKDEYAEDTTNFSNETYEEPSTQRTQHELENTCEAAVEIPIIESTNLTNEQAVADEVAFCDPRQNQVFHLLTGIQQLRREDKFSDLTVKVRGREFRCHKFVLAYSSPYFKSMIEGTDGEEIQREGPNVATDNPSSQDSNKSTVKRNEANDNKNNNSVESGDNTSEVGSSEGARGVKEGGIVRRQSGRGRGVRRDKVEEKTDAKKTAVIEKEKDTVILNGIHSNIFDKILDFIYCVFEDVINEENALELLLAADTLQLAYLSQTCASYITETLSAKNVFDVISLWDSGSARLFEHKVIRKGHQVIRENFIELAAADEFLALGRHHVISLVADSMLHVQGEMVVLQALLRWVKVRPEERSSDLTLMLQHIRFPLMSTSELDKVKEISLLRENSLAMALIEESRAYSTLDYCERMAWPRQNCISRRMFPTRDFILWTADRDKGLHFYSIIDGTHHKVTSFNAAEKPAAGPFAFDSTSSVCCYEDKIFFTGGEFTTDMTWSVDTSNGQINIHAKMPRGRKFHSMIASRGCVYCLGGQDKRGYTVLDSVDAYIISKDMWVQVGKLSVPAYNMTAVTSGGAIYLLGGVDHAGQPLRLIQCFVAMRSGLYSAFKVDVTGMPPSLLSARAVTSGLEGFIYVVCGHGEVYRFEPEKRHISHVTTIKNLSENPRVRFGLAHVGGCLVVIGGHQLGQVAQEPIRSVCLDIATRTELRDYSPILPGDIVNTCISAKLNANAMNFF